VAELRGQMGLPQYAASAQPAGPLEVPRDDFSGRAEALVEIALAARPEVRTATAAVANSRAALGLARADRIPVPSIGPAYEQNETGASFYGIAITSPIPVLNLGQTLVRQREAEYHRDCIALEQSRRQVEAQVRSVLTKWSQALESAAQTRARSEPIRVQAERMERLYEAGRADLVKLLQVRGRRIEAENAQWDAIWQTTQAYAEVLMTLGATPLLASLPEHADSESR